MDCILDDCFIPINRSVMAIITSHVEKKDMRRTPDSVEALDSVDLLVKETDTQTQAGVKLGLKHKLK